MWESGTPGQYRSDGLGDTADGWSKVDESDYRFWAVRRAEVVTGFACAVAMAASGFPIGLVWAAVAPRIDVRAVLAGSEIAFGVQADVDVSFAMICVVVALLAGVFAFWRGRLAGWPVPAGLALGGIAGSVLASWIGHMLRSSRVLSQLPDGVNPLVTQLVDFRLRSPGFLLVLPALSLLMLAVLTWLSMFVMSRRS